MGEQDPLLSEILNTNPPPIPSMPDLETLSERVCTLERTLTDGEMPELQDDAELRRTTVQLATRLDELEAKQDELDAAILALRGYVGNIRAVNDDVGRRADAALATAETCQEQLEKHDFRDSRVDSHHRSPQRSSDDDSQGTASHETPSLESVEPGTRSDTHERSLTTRIRELL